MTFNCFLQSHHTKPLFKLNLSFIYKKIDDSHQQAKLTVKPTARTDHGEFCVVVLVTTLFSFLIVVTML